MTPRTLLDLGRVSNLPTIWTNVLAGAVLSRGSLDATSLVLVGAAASLLYVGGMFLNDGFDRHFDARLRPERPIPAGHASAGQVFAIGFALLAGGVMLVGVVSRLRVPALGAQSPGWAPGVAACALAALIIFYDAFHKGNPLSAVVMGLCRAALYGMAAVTFGTVTTEVAVGALLLLIYVVGLTAVARKEATVPRLRGLVGRLIAGICLLDALLIAFMGLPALAALAALGFPLTLAG
ncbi:MAG TPA: UbiA family prenyltransferase, partial [Vicinamibacteria bacterium]